MAKAKRGASYDNFGPSTKAVNSVMGRVLE